MSQHREDHRRFSPTTTFAKEQQKISTITAAISLGEDVCQAMKPENRHTGLRRGALRARGRFMSIPIRDCANVCA